MFLFAFHDPGAVCTDHSAGGTQRAQAAAPGGISYPGSRSSGFVGGAGVVLSEVLYFPGVRGAVVLEKADFMRGPGVLSK